MPALIEQSDFTRGAFAFWERIYARDLDAEDAPKSWQPFLGTKVSKDTLRRFMFALETTYALLSRLMLAKAMQDAGFPMNSIDAYERALDAQDRRGRLDLKDYVPATFAIFEEGKKQAFQSLFASDIFDWWLDLPKLDSAAHATIEALAEATLAVFQFDFSELSGDLLGQLYQSYFDPETRKALGEFYTPPEIVEFILDHVEYQGPNIAAKRLLDPACGSGTFLVYALKRYLEASSGTLKEKLQSLRDGFRIVGFDINPFAVLMAQVNYALHLLPAYAQVLKDDPDFKIPTLPVFRTDSLRHEKREGEQDQIEERHGNRGFTFEAKGDVAKIKTELPVEVRPGKFLKVEVPVPRFDRARYHSWIDNVEEYFKVQHAMFSAVRHSREQGTSLPTIEELRAILSRFDLTHAAELARYIHPAAQKILETLGRLAREYEDGRFLKTLEDLALAMTLKHELQYDFVVGNPPYVRIQNIPELSRQYWQGIYEWAEGNFDIFIPFIERAVVYWLKEGGRLGFICSDRFLLANYAQKLREELLQLAEIELIFDLRDTRVFKDALNYPAILIAYRTDSPKRKQFVAARVFADPGEGPKALLDEAQVLIQNVKKKGPYILGKHVDAFIEQTANLSSQGWYLMPPKEWRVFRKLNKAATHRLHELTLTQSGGFQGLATGCDDVFILKFVEDRGKTLLVQPKGEPDKELEIEKELLRPWLFGRDVERWHIAWDGWYVIFPYVRIDRVYKLIPSEENAKLEPFKPYADKAPRMEDFPRAWRYLNDHKEVLQNRESGRFVHDWYGAARPQNLEFYEQEKILLQVSSTKPDVALDEQGRFVFTAGGTSGVYGVALAPKLNRWFILALLNSSLLDFYLKHVSTVYTGHSYSYGDQFIKLLPIRLPRTKVEREVAKRLANLAQKLTETKGKLRAKEQERAAFPEPQIAKLKKRPELYPVSRLVQGRPQAARIRMEDVSLQQQLDESWALRFGRSELIFPTRTHAELVKTWLTLQGQSQVESVRLMNLKLPQDEESCKKLFDLLEEVNKEIKKLQKLLSDGEEKVNDLVADFYGLNATDRKVIREFLEKF
ncbi:MAG: N-6 DNA methylase [Candidatus Bipolaricaulota bacterium]|nr:N-6 DNA methylase [Candidatus Bipolaricaulota bacterium]